MDVSLYLTGGIHFVCVGIYFLYNRRSVREDVAT